jgi:hypothetical protein
LSAEQVAGPRTQGKASGEIRWHGSQNGRVALADRKVEVKRPRLRHKREGEVKVPAYEALRKDAAVGKRMLGTLIRRAAHVHGTRASCAIARQTRE